MTQTAVEWLYEQIQKDQYADALTPLEWIKVIEQAKEMEKQQNIDFANKCIHKWKFGDVELGKNFTEQYYNETYGK